MGHGGELLDGAKVQFILPHDLFDSDIDMLPDSTTVWHPCTAYQERMAMPTASW